jgi:hypothetical protein
MAVDAPWPDAAELEAEVKRLRPIPIPWPEHHQCMRTAIAAVLRVAVEDVPPRRWGQPFPEWLASVTHLFGTYFELKEAEELPPTSGKWIAIVDTSTPNTTHAVPMIGRTSGDRRYPHAAEQATCGLVPV